MKYYRIEQVAEQTQLSSHLIRIWERRHSLVTPIRGANGFRQYTVENIALLQYVKGQLDQGYSIGDLAALGPDALADRMKAAAKILVPKLPYESVIEDLVNSLTPFDRAGFEQRLNAIIAVIPFIDVMHQVLLPLQVRIGDLWHQGQLDLSIEHYVTKHIQQKFSAAINQLHISEHGPLIVICCPAGQFHEVGAQASAYLCALRGANIFYLGADTPTTALANLCRNVRPALILLSITLALSKPESKKLIKELSSEIVPIGQVAAGGAGAHMMQSLLKQAAIDFIDTLDALDAKLLMLATTWNTERQHQTS